jgi:2,4-dienoyl-CoA reductase-like NADH-dependent reductase (Old Yellow Enzyme family)
MHLFEPLQLRGVHLKNRIAMSPMCQYSARDGHPNDWHYLHLGSRAVGGVGLVFVEATSIEARGRISPADLGIWDDAHVEPLARLAQTIQEHGAVPGIQIAHAGRKASTAPPWQGRTPLDEDNGGWSDIVAPSAIAFDEKHFEPVALSKEDIKEIVGAFGKAAERSHAAGFTVLEIHAAHGYLIHQFLSPLTNQRDDEYGGAFENRIRFAEETIRAVRSYWPDSLPLFLRVSTTDWLEGGWDLDQSIELARRIKQLGIDLVDCSSGGIASGATIPVGPGYQTEFAARVRKEAGVLTGAVGLITSPQQADHVVRTQQADLVLLGRELLREPYWALRAAQVLGQDGAWPVQYERSKSI